jgi:hypothetical protein
MRYISDEQRRRQTKEILPVLGNVEIRSFSSSLLLNVSLGIQFRRRSLKLIEFERSKSVKLS